MFGRERANRLKLKRKKVTKEDKERELKNVMREDEREIYEKLEKEQFNII